MNTRRYQLRISGLSESEGQIRAVTLERVVSALRATARTHNTFARYWQE